MTDQKAEANGEVVQYHADAAISGSAASMSHRAGLLAWHAFGSTTSVGLATVFGLGSIIAAAAVYATADFGNETTRGVFIAAVIGLVFIMVLIQHQRNRAYEGIYYKLHDKAFAKAHESLVSNLAGTRLLNWGAIVVAMVISGLIIAVIATLESPHNETVGLATALVIVGLLYFSSVMRFRDIARNQTNLPIDIQKQSACCHECI